MRRKKSGVKKIAIILCAVIMAMNISTNIIFADENVNYETENLENQSSEQNENTIQINLEETLESYIQNNDLLTKINQAKTIIISTNKDYKITEGDVEFVIANAYNVCNIDVTTAEFESEEILNEFLTKCGTKIKLEYKEKEINNSTEEKKSQENIKEQNGDNNAVDVNNSEQPYESEIEKENGASVKYNTSIQALYIIDKGSYLNMGAVYDSDDPNIKFQWLYYDVAEQSWNMISGTSSDNWTSWKPKKAGDYWITAQAIDSTGFITTYIYTYRWNGIITKLSGIYVLENQGHYDMGVVYESNDPDIKFQWKIYNVEKKQWSILQDKTTGNWTSWEPVEAGNYWLRAESIDCFGHMESYTLPYYFQGVTTELQGIGIIERKNSIDVGVAYKSNDRKLKFRWLYYDVAEKTWNMISDWSTGNWSTWKPQREGEYYIRVEAQTYNGAIQADSCIYSLESAKIKNLTVNPDTPGWTNEQIKLTASYKDFFDEVGATQFIIWDGKEWNVLNKNVEETLWTPKTIGQYLLCYQIYDKVGNLLDQTFKAYNIENPYVNLNGVYVRDDGNMNYSMAVAYESNDKDIEFRWLYYDLKKQTWNVIKEWNNSNGTSWKAPGYGNYWLHVEARVHDGTVKSDTISYNIIQEPSDLQLMKANASMYSSSTPYLILVNRSTHKVGVFQGWQGNWSCIQYWDCSDGAPSTPTVEGVFHVGIRGYYFDSGASRCYWYTQFKGNYLFHSVLYNKNGTLRDGRLGMPLSHGCVRLNINNAKWIYDTIPSGTTVAVYH